MLLSQKHDSYVDNWSVGVMLYEFLVGKPPFEHQDQGKTLDSIRNLRYNFPQSFPEGARDIVIKVNQGAIDVHRELN